MSEHRTFKYFKEESLEKYARQYGWTLIDNSNRKELFMDMIRKMDMDVLNAVLYLVENGCKWRGLPKEYGNWHVIYVRVNRWAKKGVLQEAFVRLQQLGIIQMNVVNLDSTCIKVHPDGTSALKKRTSIRGKDTECMEHQASYGCRI